MIKNILIIGQNSYIGNSFEEWILENKKNEFKINKISVKDNSWEIMDFSNYDVILCLAAIVHSKNVSKELYKKINTDLPIKIAKKAKKEGVKQFIFLSTMNVYGKDSGVISKSTEQSPTNYYGISKLEAEKALKEIHTEKFKILILRPPMVYGINCPGNYSKLSNLLNQISVFPITNNSRSAVYIDNLSYFIFKTIESEIHGILHPQNNEYLKITDIISVIEELKNKRIFKIKVPKKLMALSSITNKLYGDLKYDQNIDEYKIQLPFSVIDTFKITEKNK
ncbi:NAD-dependent epimerase/dehydratase family protein [Exiguobacterium sp.]|uniref:NAD-dependent epimerase/dehydratase family protein n=1 Tax=Exiguobacterium sp. TaxID=44751 RepID=UPI0028A6A94B|nr:NAD-dependent epimerase/dehydratase family protein [Exiguobacterium sp.]